MVKFAVNPSAPQFHRDLVADLNRQLGSVGQVESFESTGLPQASKYAMKTVYAADLGTYVLSDGTDWFPVTLGAPI